jgi:rhamnogalacturonan hydrolase
MRHWLSRRWYRYVNLSRFKTSAYSMLLDIHHITYNHVYTQNSNQMLMIKSNGGSGYVYSCQFNNFMGHSNAYTLDIDGYWSSETTAAGSGVLFYDLTFNQWHGTCLAGATRAPIQALCPAGAPCYGITIENYYIWTESGSSVLYKCENAYGSGGCLSSGSMLNLEPRRKAYEAWIARRLRLYCLA